MSVLVYAESLNGKFKKSAFELVSYAHGVAQMLGGGVTAVCINAEAAAELGTYGAGKVLQIKDPKLESFNAKAYADALTQAAKAEGSTVVILGSSVDSKFLAPILGTKIQSEERRVGKECRSRWKQYR